VSAGGGFSGSLKASVEIERRIAGALHVGAASMSMHQRPTAAAPNDRRRRLSHERARSRLKQKG
jgi:hypothetical protein